VSSLAAVTVSDDADLLAPSTVLASQFFEVGAAALQPEKRLMLAVLENAAWLLLHEPSGHDARARRRVAEAADWVESDATDWPFTFLNVCNALGLAPEWIRAGLRRRAGDSMARTAVSAHFPFRRLVATGRRVVVRRGS
jgi:hypothetical protein